MSTVAQKWKCSFKKNFSPFWLDIRQLFTNKTTCFLFTLIIFLIIDTVFIVFWQTFFMRSQLGISHFKKAWRWVWEKLHKVEVLFLNCFLNNEYFFYSDFISKRYFWIIFFRLDFSITNLLFTITFFCENSSQLKNSVTWWKKSRCVLYLDLWDLSMTIAKLNVLLCKVAPVFSYSILYNSGY